MFRMTPITLYLCGAPNIGKSHLLIYLVRALNDRLHFKHPEPAFAITLTREHWDGYKQNPIVILDDHYKMHDDKQDIDASAVFNIVSCTRFYPAFAELSLKQIEFNSSFCFITSNVGWPKTQYLSTALHRRHKHHVIVIPVSSKKKFDFSHLHFYYANTIIDPYQGVYSGNYTAHRDIPFDKFEFDNTFKFKNNYIRVSLLDLIDILVVDYLREKNVFEKLNT